MNGVNTINRRNEQVTILPYLMVPLVHSPVLTAEIAQKPLMDKSNG